MKEYMKPEAEFVDFAAEEVAVDFLDANVGSGSLADDNTDLPEDDE